MKFFTLVISCFLSISFASSQTLNLLNNKSKRHNIRDLISLNINDKLTTTTLLDSMVCELLYNNEWTLNSREFYRYNGNHQKVLDSTLVNTSIGVSTVPTWQNFAMQNSQYSADLLSEYTRYYWISSSNDWLSALRNTLIYDNGLLIQENIENGFTGPWILDGKLLYLYDQDDMLNEIHGYAWENNSWDLSSKDTFGYNSEGLLDFEWYRIYFDDSLYNDEIYYHFYNQEGLLTETLIQYWPENGWENNEKDFYYYETGMDKPYQKLIQYYENGQWIDGQRCNFYYQDVSPTINPMKFNKIDCLFQNPLSSQASITCNSKLFSTNLIFTLTDIYGRTIIEQPIDQILETISIPSGFYLLNIFEKKGEILFKDKVVISH